MATKAQPREQPEGNWQPPRGIRYLPTRETGNRRYGLQWRADGKRQFQFFETESAREDMAKALVKKAKKHGEVILTFNPDGWREYLDAKRMAESKDLRQVVAEWLSFRPEAKKAVAISVADAVDQYLAHRYETDIDRTSDSGRHFELHLRKRFAARFGARKLAEVTPEDIDSWLRSIVSARTKEPIGLQARIHNRKDVNTLYEWAREVKKWVSDNPCSAVILPKIIPKDVQLLTVQQTRDLLAANINQPVAPKLALELFGGLRAASVERLQKEHVDWDRKGIRMPASLHKTGKTIYRQGHPDVLWEWLAKATDETWEYCTGNNYMHEKIRAIRRAFGQDAQLPHNSFRHSFASYHLAMWKSLPNTSYFMQHTNTHTTTIYEGMANESDAKAYFGLTPSAVTAT